MNTNTTIPVAVADLELLGRLGEKLVVLHAEMSASEAAPDIEWWLDDLRRVLEVGGE